MDRIIKVESGEAPKAIGPYSQAVVAGSFMTFCLLTFPLTCSPLCVETGVFFTLP
jgi:hypothetical protein